jgi:hypothetical protein
MSASTRHPRWGFCDPAIKGDTMKWNFVLLVVLGLGGIGAPAAEEKPVVAIIGTGTPASTFGPAVGRAGYPVVYGSRDPARASVNDLVKNTGSNASAASPREAAAKAQLVILAVPRNVFPGHARGQDQPAPDGVFH